MNALLHWWHRHTFRRYGRETMIRHMVGKVHPLIIQAAIATHLNSPQKEVRWLGEGMEQAYGKHRDKAWEELECN